MNSPGASDKEPPVGGRMSMQVLGLGEQDELIYRTLLRHPAIGSVQLAQLTGLSPQGIGALLAELQRRGLVHVSHGAASVWEATNPEVAVELLLMERQLELHKARHLIPELREDLARQASRPVSTDIQILEQDGAVQLKAYLELHERAQHRIDLIVRPPFLASMPDAMEAAKEAARRRGVQARIILSTEVMRLDGWQDAVRQATAAGDQIRVLADPPFKLLLVDGSAALLPLRADDADGPALRLGRLAVVQALEGLFEVLWAQGVPVDQMASLTHDEAASDLDASLEELITVLASGANDKAAAHILGISDRTLQRRLGALNAGLHARSRFQAGWLAALRRMI